MLRGLTLPATWRGLLKALRPAFRRGSTFAMFMLLASGPVAQTARRTVVGMLAATGMAAIVSFHTCCRILLGAPLGHRSARARLGVADRVAAAGRARGDRGRHRRHLVS